jgi:hypothetical protein
MTNRISTHGPATKLCKCKYKRCQREFASPQALAMHIGRVHTKTIPTASAKRASNHKPKRRYTKRQVPTAPPAAECCVTGPGLRVEFTAALLPTILHTIALALGGKKGR